MRYACRIRCRLQVMSRQAVENTTHIRNALLRWYRATARQFPWRTPTPDSYVVLVSECMLQQTQASRIAERLPQFLEEFPSIRHLATASNAHIIRQWRGLGYNSRALRLRDAARIIVEYHGGIVPSSVDTLKTLPGLGPYTAAAIACFAYNRAVVVLDVNIRRVYSRLTRRMATTSDVLDPTTLQSVAEALIPPRRAAAWHHAVMDLGATICTARSPQCNQCPLSHYCPSKGAMAYVPKQKRTEPSFRGEPNRLWRGRIVEALRGVDDGTSDRRLFRAVTGTPLHDTNDREWFRGILAALRRDGIVHPTDLRLAD